MKNTKSRYPRVDMVRYQSGGAPYVPFNCQALGVFPNLYTNSNSKVYINKITRITLIELLSDFAVYRIVRKLTLWCRSASFIPEAGGWCFVNLILFEMGLGAVVLTKWLTYFSTKYFYLDFPEEVWVPVCF